MRLVLSSLILLTGLFNIASAQEIEAKAKQPATPSAPAGWVSVQDFHWGADGRFNVKITANNQTIQFRGDLRDNSKSQPVVKNQTMIVLRHFQQGFLVLVVSGENDEIANVFLIEGFASPFIIMNSRPIQARKLVGASPEDAAIGVVTEVEGLLEGFKVVAGFDTAQAMRKMTEYFIQNPNKNTKDLLGSIEREEASVKVMAKPRGSSNNDQGIVQPHMPSEVAQSGQEGVQDPQHASWLAQEKARLRAERERRAREIVPRQQPVITGYDMFGRPVYAQRNVGGYYPSQQQPQYPPQPDPWRQQQNQQQQNRPGFFSPFF